MLSLGLNHTKDQEIGQTRFSNAGELLFHLLIRRARPSHRGAGVEAKLDFSQKMELFNCIS